MKKLLLLTCTTLSLMASEPQVGVDALSNGVRSLLSQEMLALEKGMHSIFSSTISGDYDAIVTKATQIQNSFILKQNLTKEQRAELKAKVPKEFIVLDRGFHEKAGELAAAAEFGDAKAVSEIYSQMTQTCVKCHSTYAQSRFSNFEE